MSPKNLQILIIEDSEDDALLLVREIRKAGYAVTYARVQTGGALDDALHRQDWDVILSDYYMPSFTALDALRIIRAFDRDIPAILISGAAGEDAAVETMKAGAHDFFTKDKLQRLVPAIERELAEADQRRKRRLAEQQLLKSKERFEVIFQASTIGKVISRLSDNQILEVNRQFLDMFGHTRDVIGKGFWDVEPGLTLKQQEEIRGKLQKAASIQNVELAYNTANANPNYALYSAESIEIDGEPCMLSMVHDITERKRAQEEIRFQAQLLDAVGQAVIATDLSGKITYWNRAADRLYGWSFDEVHGKYIVDVMVQEPARQRAEETLMTLSTAQSQTGEVQLQRRDGSIFPALVTTAPIYDNMNNPIGVIGTSTDISTIKNYEIALREAERFFRSTVDALSANIAILDETGMIIAVNKRWIDYGLANGSTDPNGYKGTNYLAACDAVTGRSAATARSVAAGIRAVIRGAQAEFVLEYDCQFPSPPCWYMVRVTRFLGDGPVRAVVSHTDITERKEAELELQALYNATAYLFKSDNLRNLGYQIVQAISQEFSETDCALLLADKPNNQMQPLVYSENYAYPIGKVGENLRLDSLGLLSEVALTGKEAYIPQASHDAGANGKVETLRSQLILPLKAPDNIIGVLDLRRTGANAFSERDQRILSAFALRAANALKVLQLNEKLNHYAAQLETRVATRTAELQQSKNWAEAILANTSDVLLLSDAEGRVVQANPAFARQFLVSADFLIGKPLTSLIAQSSQKSFEEAVQQARDSLQPIDLDLVCIRSDDSLFEAEITIAPLMNKSSTSTNMVFSLRDITRHKQIEKSLRNALANEKELNELKSRFTSMVSHEFRTPLTVILSSTGILKSYADRLTPERRQGKLDSIEEQVKRLVKMLDAILLYSRAESISVESTRHLIDLQESCKQVISELQQIADQHLIDFMVVGEPYLVSMDSNLISEALRNLLSNAIKYSPGREKIDVTLQFNADHIWLKVRDYGIGIPEQDQKHLFEAFHRASNVGSISGTGLGLAIVDRAVKAHRGTIQVESQLNQGTAFVITIPRE